MGVQTRACPKDVLHHMRSTGRGADLLLQVAALRLDELRSDLIKHYERFVQVLWDDREEFGELIGLDYKKLFAVKQPNPLNGMRFDGGEKHKNSISGICERTGLAVQDYMHSEESQEQTRLRNVLDKMSVPGRDYLDPSPLLNGMPPMSIHGFLDDAARLLECVVLLPQSVLGDQEQFIAWLGAKSWRPIASDLEACRCVAADYIVALVHSRQFGERLSVGATRNWASQWAQNTFIDWRAFKRIFDAARRCPTRTLDEIADRIEVNRAVVEHNLRRLEIDEAELFEPDTSAGWIWLSSEQRFQGAKRLLAS